MMLLQQTKAAPSGGFFVELLKMEEGRKKVSVLFRK